MPVHSSAKPENSESQPLVASCSAKKVSGRNTSTSRIALRATTAAPVSRPPSRATTRSFSSRLPGVAPRLLISNSVNQPLRSRNSPISHNAASELPSTSR